VDVPEFLPVTPGCSRRVDIVIDTDASSVALRLKGKGTVDGKRRRDRDTFRYRR